MREEIRQSLYTSSFRKRNLRCNTKAAELHEVSSNTKRQMRRFILNIFIFGLILATFYGVIYGRFLFMMNSYSLRLPKEKTILLIGESQSQAAVDDSKIENLYNLSQSQERYMTTYCRLKAVLEQNPQIDTVILSLTPHSINRGKDDFWENGGYLRQIVQWYGALLGWREWRLMLRHAPETTLAEIVTPLQHYLKVNESYTHQIGYYEAADYCALEANIAEGGSSLKVDPSFGNAVTLEYLDKIVCLCADKRIKLIGLNTPVYHAWEYEEPQYFYDYIATHYPDLELWDYLDADIPDDYRRDINHLNKKGAEWFTELIKNRF